MLPDPMVLSYVGRDEAASPATGSKSMHDAEEQEIVAHALEIKSKEVKASGVTAPGTAASAATPEAGAQ